MSVQDISPADLKARLDSGEKPFLLDVREPVEVEVASIDGATCIPMNEVPYSMDEFDPSAEIVVFCHHGGRSMQVAQLLSMRGFSDVKNLAGGIDAWAVLVDRSIPRYQFNGQAAQVIPNP